MTSQSWKATSTPDDWSNAAEWTSAVPGASDAVTLGGTSTYTVTVTAESEAASSVSITDANATLDIEGNGTVVGTLLVGTSLVNQGTLDVGSTTTHGGSLTVTGTLYTEKTTNIGNSGQTVATTVALGALDDLFTAANLVLAGASGATTTVTVTGAANNKGAITIGGFSTLSASTFTQIGGSTAVNAGGTLSVVGTLTETAGTIAVAATGVLTAATVNLSGGTLTLNELATGTLSGSTYVVSGTGTLVLGADVTTLDTNLTLTGTRAVVKGTNTIQSTLTTIDAGRTLTLTGGQAYSATSTSLTVATGATLAIAAGSSLSTTKALTVNGTLTDAGALNVTTATGVITFTTPPTTLTGALTVGVGAEVTTGGVLASAGRVTDAGTINNSTSSGNVLTMSGTGRLILDPGFAITGGTSGVAQATGTNNVLELAKGTGTGTLALGTQITGFGTVVADSGAIWTVNAAIGEFQGTLPTITGSNVVNAANVLNVGSAGTVNLTKVSGFPTINLAAGANTVTATAAGVSGKTLTGAGTNTLGLTTVGGMNLENVSAFGSITLAAGNSTVIIGNTTLSLHAVTIHDGASGTNIITATPDTTTSIGRSLTYVVGAGSSDTFYGGFENDTITATAGAAGKTLTFHAGSGTDSLTGGAETDIVTVSAAAVGGDTLTGSSSLTNKLTLTTAGTFSLAGVSNFGTILLANGNNTVTATEAQVSGTTLTGVSIANVNTLTLSGTVVSPLDLTHVSKIGTINLAAGGGTVDVGSTTLTGTTALKQVTINDAATGSANAIVVSGATGSEYLTYNATISGDSFSGGAENDTVKVSAANLGSGGLTGGGGSNTLVLTTSGSVTFPTSGVSGFGALQLAAGGNNVTVGNLAGGSLTIADGASGNNIVAATGDTSGTLTYTTGVGSDFFLGGAAADIVNVSAAAVGNDTLFGGSGSNTLALQTAGTFSLNGVRGFDTIDLKAGNNVVVVTNNTLFGSTSLAPVTVVDGASGNNVIYVKGASGEFFNYTAGANSTDTFILGGESDTITAGTHSITVRAGTGAQALTGGSGTNAFYAGGDTTMNAGAGINEYLFTATAQLGTNTVASLGTGTGKLVFSNSAFHLGFSGASATPQVWTPVEQTSAFNSDGTGTFTTTAQRLSYNTSTDTLWYSATGSAGASTEVASLTSIATSAAVSSHLFFVS